MNCIFHIPFRLDPKWGSHVRPPKMLQAFRDIGCQVDVVAGGGAERKRKIREIEEKIRQGTRYGFVYSESSTLPTLLTEEDHVPRYPFLDFDFFRSCKDHDIPIGLFYRDMHWRFPFYKRSVHGLKYIAAQLLYRYDLRQYQKLLSVLFVPAQPFARYIGRPALEAISVPLPAGAQREDGFIARKGEQYRALVQKRRPLRLFYVGGIGRDVYDFRCLFQAAKGSDLFYLTVCCREHDWNDCRQMYEPYLNDRIQIVHGSGAELEKYYQEADICMAWYANSLYRDIGMPIKVFEYLGRTIPVITLSGTPAAAFTERYGTGWALPYDKDQLTALLRSIYEDPAQLLEKHENCMACLEQNTWEARARTVVSRLCRDRSPLS